MSLSFVNTAVAAAIPRGEKTPLDLDPETTEHAANGGSLTRTIVGLLIVLAVIYGLHWVMKQVQASKHEKTTGRGLEQVATLALGPNRSLHVVRAGGEVLVVGSAENGVSPIRSYSEDEALALGLIASDEENDVIEATVVGERRDPVALLKAWTVRK